MESFLLPLLILALFVPLFLASRRQKKAAAQAQALQSSLAAGEKVMTTSGLRGVVVDASADDTIDLEIAPGITTTWLRAAIRERITEPTESTETSTDIAEDGSDTPVDGQPKAEVFTPIEETQGHDRR